MTLEDRLRGKTFLAKDRLQGVSEEIRELGLKVGGLQRECQELEKEAGDRAGGLAQGRRIVEEKNAEVRRLEDRISALRSEIANLTEDLVASQEGDRAASTAQLRKRKEIGRLEHRRQELVESKKDLGRQVRGQACDALREHMLECEESFCGLVRATMEAATVESARERFEKARQTDADLMDLWEQVVELRNLIRDAKVPAVRAMLDGQLRSLEADVEARFPGALRDPGSGSELREIGELYWGRPGDGRRVIFVPAKRGVEALRAGHGGCEAEFAARILWSLGRAFGAGAGRVEIRDASDWLEVAVWTDGTPEEGWRDVDVPLPGGDKLALLMLPLPSEVERSIWSDEEPS